MRSEIRYIERAAIDELRWNQCIDSAPNGLLYARTGYLDRAAVRWDGLVRGDYEQVMPVTYNRKFGIAYAFQPVFCASLGIFGRHCDADTVGAFLAALPRRFRLVEIDLNAGNYYHQHGDEWITRNNYILDLSPGYDVLFRKYRETHRRNIRRCVEAGCRYSVGLPLHELLVLIQTHAAEEKNLTRDQAARFTRLYQWLEKEKQAEIAAVHAPEGTLLAAAAFFGDGRRWFYILAGNHPDGKSLGASHYLVDRFIASRAGEGPGHGGCLDFEGSDLQGVAFFYSGFGASLEHYPGLRINRLPGWMKAVRGMVGGGR